MDEILKMIQRMEAGRRYKILLMRKICIIAWVIILLGFGFLASGWIVLDEINTNTLIWLPVGLLIITIISLNPNSRHKGADNPEKSEIFDYLRKKKYIDIFKSEIEIHEFPEVDIYGFGFSDFHCTDFDVEIIKIKNKEKINILLIHGSIDASTTLEMRI